MYINVSYKNDLVYALTKNGEFSTLSTTREIIDTITLLPILPVYRAQLGVIF